MPNDKYREERRHQRATVTRHLHAALEHLQQARTISIEFALDIEIANDITRAISDVIAQCAHDHQQENPHEQAG